MLNDRQQQVNQRLYHFQLQLEAAECMTECTSAMAETLAESLFFHLRLSYQAYLQELAEIYRVVLPGEIFSAQHLLVLLNAEGISAGEVSELSELETDSGWLSEYQQIWRQHARAMANSAAVTRSSNSEIALVEVKHDEVTADIANARRGGDALRQLIERQRSHFDEW